MKGSPLLALLPVLAFVLGWAILAGDRRDSRKSLCRAFVLTAVAWGSYLAIATEILSLFRSVTSLSIGLVWLVPTTALGIWVRRSGSLMVAWDRLRLRVTGLSRADWLIVAGFAVVALVLLGVALISPPNTYDSALYHMARVVHWAQNGSLAPYPVHFEHQLYKPIWAETVILHLRLLWGSDRPAGLVQWFSMLSSLVVVSGIASALKAGQAAPILAAAFAVSIPMGVVQATSTQNDYVAAFWAVCLAYLVLRDGSEGRDLSSLVAVGAAAGLGALTKGTFFVYGPPFIAWFLIRRWRYLGFRKAVVSAAVVAGVAGLLNAGFWGRNVQVYGGPYGTSEWLQRNLWVRLFEEPPAPEGRELPTPSAEPAEESPQAPGGYLARLAQTAGRNLALPTGTLSRAAVALVESAPGVFGDTYADELRAVSWNHEESAGNPIHLLLVPASLLALSAVRRDRQAGPAITYAGVALLTFALIPVVIGHGASVHGIRYQLSFFVLWAPVFGAAFAWLGRDRWFRPASAFLLILALPWVVFNKTRPLIGMPPLRTWSSSILVEPQENLLVPWNPGLLDDYALAAGAVEASGCSDVEIRAEAAFPEYPIWWLLDAPQSGVRIENLEVAPYLRQYIDPSFTPCAIVCTNCDHRAAAGGLPLFGVYDSMDVYLADADSLNP